MILPQIITNLFSCEADIGCSFVDVGAIPVWYDTYNSTPRLQAAINCKCSNRPSLTRDTNWCFYEETAKFITDLACTYDFDPVLERDRLDIILKGYEAVITKDTIIFRQTKLVTPYVHAETLDNLTLNDFCGLGIF